MSQRRSLFAELKRRRVLRVAGVYIVAALGVLQAAQLILPSIAPPFVYDVLVIVALLGLPVSVALAWAFDITPDGIQRTTSADATTADEAPKAHAPRTTSLRRLAPAAIVIVAIGLFSWGAWRKSQRATPLDGNLVAVLPFRVTGNTDLRYLREGMIDLLNARLGDNPHPVDARTLVAAWRRAVKDSTSDLTEAEALDVARGLGAGRVLLGSVVGTGNRLTFNARLYRIGGRTVESGPIEGSADSVTALVDRLLAAVLSLDAGEKLNDVPALTATSLPAVRAYLDGRAFERRAHYPQAVVQYNKALSMDSTFALAALSNTEAGTMLFGSDVRADARSGRIAREYRHRLPPDDRAYADVKFAPLENNDVTSRLAKWEAATKTLPDRPEVWYHLGDELFHNAPLANHLDHLERSEAALRRAVELDSLYVMPLVHLGWVAAARGDSAGVMRYARAYLAIEQKGANADYARKLMYAFNHDSAALQAWSDSLAVRPSVDLRGHVLGDLTVPLDGVELRDAQRAAELLVQRATTTAEAHDAHRLSARVALNAGQPIKARQHRVPTDPSSNAQSIFDALYWDGDTAAARTAASALAKASAAGASTEQRLVDACALQQWRIMHGDVSGADVVVKKLLAPPPNTTRAIVIRLNACAAIVDALAAVTARRADALEKTMRLDSAAFGKSGFFGIGALAAARLYELQGRDAQALDAARRMPYLEISDQYRSTYVRERARLAAKLGHIDEAKRYYREYLLYRSNPEAPLVAERDRIRAELARLSGERGRS